MKMLLVEFEHSILTVLLRKRDFIEAPLRRSFSCTLHDIKPTYLEQPSDRATERSAHGFGQIFIYYCVGQVVTCLFLSSRVIYRDPLGTPGTRCRPLYVRSRAPRLAWSGLLSPPATGALFSLTLPYVALRLCAGRPRVLPSSAIAADLV